MNDLLKSGANAVLVVVIMIFGSLVLWIGVPVFWLWVGGQVQGSTQSIGLALGAAAIGAFATIGVLVACLGWLNRKTVELREARGFKVKPGTTPLEIVMAICASIAIAAFGFWFFILGGSSPIPLMGQGG
jgi:hypothetical protein